MSPGALASCTRRARRAATPLGFTLLELLIALALLSLIVAVLYGSLNLAGRSWDGGEAKAEATAGMRLAQEFLRAQFAGQHPQRQRRQAEFPLLFAGERDEVRYVAPLPERVEGGGLWVYRLALAREGDRSRLVVDRWLPDLNAVGEVTRAETETTVIADDIEELRLAYLGRDAGSTDATEPTWRDRWDDRQRLPFLVRIDIRPKRGAAWPSLVVAPREGSEAGCRAWDPARGRCQGV